MSDPDIEVRTYFAREKNALVARGDFSEIYAAWYLHRVDNKIEIDDSADAMAKDALAAVTLHCAGRPWKVTCAWTVQLPHPRMNIFAAGDNNTGTVIVNLLTENLQPIDKGVFCSDMVEGFAPSRRSVVDFEAHGFFGAVEAFYEKSEQRKVRFFHYGDDEFVMVAAQPDCDMEWLDSLTDELVRKLDASVELSLLEKRTFSFECGCNQERMLDFILPIFRREAEELFGKEQSIRILCPRCGARHTLTREALEARSNTTA
jgi:molecular chaperone Hsp33